MNVYVYINQLNIDKNGKSIDHRIIACEKEK